MLDKCRQSNAVLYISDLDRLDIKESYKLAKASFEAVKGYNKIRRNKY